MQRRWILPKSFDSLLVNRLALDLRLPPAMASLLAAKGFTSAEEATEFLDPRLASLRPPEEIPGIPAAVECLHQALQHRKKIVLYGDYDVDGISALALLYRFLRAAGGIVDCFVPERGSEGYGLSAAGLERCFAEHAPELLVAVDCGTNSLSEADLIRKRGVDLIILDHHEPSATTATHSCTALVNPKLGSDFEYLCSAGVVFKLCHALLKKHPVPNLDLRHYLDLVAMATVADIVPLIGENRILVRSGLKQLSISRWAGLNALLAVTGAVPPYSVSDIGYKLGPRINAAGRIGSAREALQLLITDSSEEAARIANRLDTHNRERQAVERSVSLEAEEWVSAHFDPARQTSIVAGRRDWHQGVVGIVASRIARRWHRPTLIVGFDEQGAGKGSGRSIEGLPLVEALGRCANLLDAFGGHDMAAGLSLQESRLDALREAFETATRELLREEDLVPRLELQAEVDLAEADAHWLAAQERLAPFGAANPQPIFFARAVSPAAAPRVLKEKHLRFDFTTRNRHPTSAIFFNGAVDELPRPPWDVAFTIERNTYQGRSEAQVQIVAIRAASAS